MVSHVPEFLNTKESGSLIFTHRDAPDKIARWLDEGKKAMIVEFNAIKVGGSVKREWGVGDLEDLLAGSICEDGCEVVIAVIDVESLPVPNFLAEQVGRLREREDIVVFCKNIPSADHHPGVGDSSAVLREFLPKRGRANNFRIATKLIPKLGKALG